MHAFSFTETEAAEYAASMMEKSDQTMRRWRSALIDKDRVLPNWSKGAIYQRSSVLWQNEELRILLLPTWTYICPTSIQPMLFAQKFMCNDSNYYYNNNCFMF